MAFLTDILGKKSKKLNFRKKPIGFEEDRQELCVVPQTPQILQKSQIKTIIEKENVLDLKLRPPLLANKKITDIARPKKTSGIEAFYRLFQISPQKTLIKQEILRFASIGLTVVFLLNILGAYTKGITLKKNLEVQATGAYESLKEATNSAKNQDFIGMFNGFYQVSQILEAVEKDLDENLHIQADSGNSPLQSVALLLRAGKHLSKSGEYLAKTIYGVQQLPADFMQQNNEEVENAGPSPKITDKIKAYSGYLTLASMEIEDASELLDQIEYHYLPEEFQDNFLELHDQLQQAKTIITLIQGYVPYVLDLLGDRYPQSYMILLQNNHEIRATGGFIGSYILMDINDGEITKFELKDVYEADGQFYKTVEPPKGLHKITENWRMRDANYSPDFPTSAEQVMWFLEHEKGPTVDTVIAINQRVVESLLEKIGPVTLPGENIGITAESFSWVFSYLIEAKFSESNSPKQFLMDFAPEFKNKLLKPENIPAILEVVQDSIARKDIMAYSTNDKVKTLINRFKLDGKIPNIDETFDYLQVINTSVGGNKSDGFISQKIIHNTDIDSNGNVLDNLTLTRRHNWYHAEDTIFNDLYAKYGSGKLQKQELKDILGFGGNKSLIRIYVPYGSKILSATGGVALDDIMVYEDLGMTVFAFEQPVIYTEKEFNLNLRYQLPHQLDLKYADNYKMIVQNQPGQEENYFEKTITLQGDGKILEHYPQEITPTNEKSVSFEKLLTGDEYLSVLIGRR